ncbi:MAG: hypothetical protein PF482_18875 [Desulfobacteraceae bacterium]|jgi:hypothetical protein|nr:hypothetical protein [Desulfobacteraceae bacterium]
MTIDNYLNSHEFLKFQDENLRQNACSAVEIFLKDNKPVKNRQLHGIPPTIQVQSLPGLKKLIEKQKSKETNQAIKTFWGFLYDLILALPGPEYSLRQVIENELKSHNLLTEDSGSLDKIEQKIIRKSNRNIINEVLAQSLHVYFEHFNCHYFYLNRQGA